MTADDETNQLLKGTLLISALQDVYEETVQQARNALLYGDNLAALCLAIEANKIKTQIHREIDRICMRTDPAQIRHKSMEEFVSLAQAEQGIEHDVKEVTWGKVEVLKVGESKYNPEHQEKPE